jgi:hypothetical protein
MARTLLVTRAMRSCFALACLLGACATDAQPAPPEGDPMDAVWPVAITPGDLVVLVPSTGAIDYLATPIQAMPGPVPLVDVRDPANAKVASDAIVFEQAIGAAHRAGITDQELEDGALTFALWGAGFTSLQAFDYQSYEGIRIRVTILGGTNSCATGLVVTNLLNYTKQNATIDATDLYTRTQAWFAAHPSPGAPRHVIIDAHSWGGAVAEYLAYNLAAITAPLGPLTDGSGTATMPLTVADGVPAFLLGYTFPGPGLRGYTNAWIYEVDRPDDPVHAMNPSGNPDGHNYDILVGSDFLGSYGVTTTELACAGVAGICAKPTD